MNFFGFNDVRTKKLVRRTISSGLNLLIIASFLAAPTSIALLPSPSSAASLPAPAPWMADILKYLKDGNLFDIIRILTGKADGSMKRLKALVNRINALANRMGLTNRLFVQIPDEVTIGDQIYPELVIFDGAGKEIAKQKCGPFTYDIDVGAPISD